MKTETERLKNELANTFKNFDNITGTAADNLIIYTDIDKQEFESEKKKKKKKNKQTI